MTTKEIIEHVKNLQDYEINRLIYIFEEIRDKRQVITSRTVVNSSTNYFGY